MKLVLAEKKCGKCGEVKPLSEFHRNRTTPDGLQWECKPCVIARVKASTARRRAEMGEEAFLATRGEAVQRHRAKHGTEDERRQSRARATAVRRLIAAHRAEFDAYYRLAKDELRRAEQQAS